VYCRSTCKSPTRSWARWNKAKTTEPVFSRSGVCEARQLHSSIHFRLDMFPAYVFDCLTCKFHAFCLHSCAWQQSKPCYGINSWKHGSCWIWRFACGLTLTRPVQCQFILFGRPRISTQCRKMNWHYQYTCLSRHTPSTFAVHVYLQHHVELDTSEPHTTP